MELEESLANFIQIMGGWKEEGYLIMFVGYLAHELKDFGKALDAVELINEDVIACTVAILTERGVNLNGE